MIKLILTGIIASLLMVWVDFAASPNFSLSPASGQQLKLHCNYNLSVVLDPDTQEFNAFASTVKFNSWDVAISHILVNSPLDHNYSGFVAWWNLYRAYGAFLPGQRSSLITSVATFSFKTITNITSTLLQFTTYTWWTLTFAPDATDDKTNINWYAVASADILWAVYDASYSFIPFPCVIDVDAPSFNNVSPALGAYHVLSGQKFSAVVYDWRGIVNVSGPAPLATNSTRHYRYNWLSTGNLNNYIVAPTTWVDNQEWVNSWTIQLTVSCPTCASFGGPYPLSGSALHLVTWTWDATRNQITWDNYDRGYTLWFDPPMSYEVEKQVFVTGIAVDNPNYLSWVHTWLLNISFNAPRAPVITPLYPTANATYVDWRNTLQVQLYLSDDWAGIDTWTIEITLPEIMSGLDVLMTGYTYSGSDLEIVLSGGALWLGNSGSYFVQFTPKWPFASNTWIKLTGSVFDLAGTEWTLDITFTTRPSCQDWWCSEIFQVITLTGDYNGIFDFSWSLIIITWTDINSPYPYLTWVDGDILMCGFPYTGTILTGNIPIADSQGASVKGSLYTWIELYITWLNFVVQNWVIVILP